MTNIQNEESINKFFKGFFDPVQKTLVKNLDADVCSNISFVFNSSAKINETDSLKENNVICKLDFATGNRQGSLIVLIPEELIAFISDLLTGGNGEGSYKGSLSEIETNSISDILLKTFKIVEDTFKAKYEEDLVFSAHPQLLLKENPEYDITTENLSFDFLLSTTLSLNEKNAYKIGILNDLVTIEGLLKDLNLLKPKESEGQFDISSLNVNRLADVKINITAELGRTQVPIKHALELVGGSLVELDTLNNSDIRVFANGIEFARAQIVAVEDNFGLKITKIITPEERLEKV